MIMTKIVATLGPACSDKIKELIQAGMNVARINFSHGDYESHKALTDKLKAARSELNKPVSLILDTKGPEIRLGKFKNDSVNIKAGSIFKLTTNETEGDETKVSVTYKNLPNDLKRGGKVLLDDGLIELEILELTDTDVVCRAINSGVLSSNKGVNVPDVYVNLPAITSKDVEDIKFGIENDFDYIAASFVRCAEDVIKIRDVLDKNAGSHIKIIAKIENRSGVDNIDEILQIADGIMVARGDLGVEIPPEEVPLVQKMLIEKANNAGKPVITATQMLESMVSNLRPTRAEANDVANAILDGSDAVMLSGETAKGKYPIESVKMMARIALKTQTSLQYHDKAHYKDTSITNAISFATCAIASELNVACIATVTDSGFTARRVSKFRPSCPILAITHHETVYRQLSLTWGCMPVMADKFDLHDESFSVASTKALEVGLAKPGDSIVIAAGVPLGIAGTTNTLKVETVINPIAK